MAEENTEKPALPPTPTRIQLAKDMKAGLVKCWHFIAGPEICRTYDDRKVTAEVAAFVYAGLAEIPAPKLKTSKPCLTPAGEEWLKTYGGTE